MINKDLIEVFSEIAREKNVERSQLASIIEELFLYVIEKEYNNIYVDPNDMPPVDGKLALK